MFIAFHRVPLRPRWEDDVVRRYNERASNIKGRTKSVEKWEEAKQAEGEEKRKEPKETGEKREERRGQRESVDEFN